MKELLDKISSYNLFNYLLPGVVFVCAAKYFTDYDFVQDKELLGAFLYYFIGMVISRFGSIVIEPFLKYIKFVEFADYNDFVKASEKDTKVELFSEVNNTYRTILAMALLLVVLKLYRCIQITYEVSNNITHAFLISSLLLLFLFSYKKQTSYITKRINATKTSNHKDAT